VIPPDTDFMSVNAGLGSLGPVGVRTLRHLDEAFRELSSAAGAIEVARPPLLRPSELALVDYFQNFPHLFFAVAPASADAIEARLLERPSMEVIPTSQLGPGGYVLPSAACYGVFLGLRETSDSPVGAYGVKATCFRHEQRFDGPHRLIAFEMRECVFLGTEDYVKDAIAALKSHVLEFAERIGLDITVDLGLDPFFEQQGPRAMMQRLFPVKEEALVQNVAIASFNYHRNFFGERCNIRTDGRYVHSGCVAFGLERWLQALEQTSNGDTDSIANRIAEARVR
jgi:hypothetical protein